MPSTYLAHARRFKFRYTKQAASAAFFMRISRPYAFGLLFFTLSWLAYDHYRPWVNFHAELMALIGLGFLLASAIPCQSNFVSLPRACAWIAVVVLVPWFQYAGSVSSFAGDALMSSLYLSGLLAAVYVGYHLTNVDTRKTDDDLTWLMYCLWIAAMVSSVIGLAQWLNVDNPLGMYVIHADAGDRAMGNLGQPNQLATLLLMGMSACTYVFERGAIGRLAFALCIGFMTGVLILTQSRTGMLSVLIVAAYLMWRKGAIKSRLSGKAVACWAACFLIGTLALPYLNELLLLSDVRSIRSPEAISERFRIWQQIGYAVMQSPWVGYGWNQTATASAVGAIAYPGSLPYTYAHNFVLDMLAWNGLPLGLLLTGAVAYWFVTRIIASKRLDAVYAMTCLLPLAVHSMLEYPFAYAYFLITAGLMVGVVEASQVPVRMITLNVRWAWGLLALWLPIGSCLTYEYFLIEEDFRVVRFENLRIGKTSETYEIPDVWMLSQMGTMLKSRRLVIEPNMQKTDLETLRVVSQRFADNVPHFRYALALALNDDPAKANHQLAIIRGMYGNAYYLACQRELRRLMKEKYPQLAAVVGAD
ncbi:MAG: Wzy polymerase domain-containing protein [Rhodoferax sp.]|uniref:PglL family O-oligosaccharyltransferase n=1 Tax=Rhodoferax sp. TaxID=50421 RepID=UPI0026389D06|nr:O-antigen ligase family protein [Rhodoferax sp.]MDD2881990.1 Wzy polymerase domain-containing protein [Rhodoferax sp.]